MVLVLAGALAADEAVAFTAKPVLVQAGGTVTVTFTVAVPTDVEVSIVDG